MHTCPECGQACSCSGDIEDHDTGDENYVSCEHFLTCVGDEDEPNEWDEDAHPNKN